MNGGREFLQILSEPVRKQLEKTEISFAGLQEVRIRVGRPVLLRVWGKEYSLDCLAGQRDIQETLSYAGNYSLYAYEHELKQGFLTIEGGHRIGIAGKMVMEGNRIKNIKYISFLNIRITHEKKGCADELLPYIIDQGRICHTLLVSPPRGGKTTILRDLVRQLSNGTKFLPGVTVGVVDVRSEIGGSYMGVPQNDLGMRTDVLDCCPKSEGMQMLVRSMSPDVVAVDELGCEEDFKAVETVIHCGCKLIATAHGESLEDILDQPFFYRLMSEKIFERYIILGKNDQAGYLEGVLDENGRICLKQ